MKNGETPVEGGERPLYRGDVEKLIAAYAREGSPEAMTRKLELDTAWLSGGRGGEMALLAWEGMLVRILLSVTCSLHFQADSLECRSIRRSKSSIRMRCSSRSLS